ncbi:MAG: TRAP transporter small permease subunit [Aestuariivita sp.]|nr:TRAP transporter small permease subunit [Aestuariivita sp.]
MLIVANGLDRLNHAVASIVRWFTVVMALIQFGIVVGRYVFGVNSIAAQESVLYLHAAVFMLGAGYTLLTDGHVRIDIFYAHFSQTFRDRIDLLGHVFLLLPSMTVLLVWSWPSVRNSWAILEGPISVGGIEAVFLLKSLIPIFCILLILQSLAIVIRLLIPERR